MYMLLYHIAFLYICITYKPFPHINLIPLLSMVSVANWVHVYTKPWFVHLAQLRELFPRPPLPGLIPAPCTPGHHCTKPLILKNAWQKSGSLGQWQILQSMQKVDLGNKGYESKYISGVMVGVIVSVFFTWCKCVCTTGNCTVIA